MARLTRKEMIDRGILRVDEQGQIHLAPLANPYALLVDDKTDPELAKEFGELSLKLRELGKDLESNGPSEIIEQQIASNTKRLEQLSVSLEIRSVDQYTQATIDDSVHFYCDCCFLPLNWRNGPRNVVELSEKQKMEELSLLTQEELDTLASLGDDDLENLRSLVPVELRKGRDHFAHTGYSRTIHERGPGASLSKQLRNYIYFLAADNGWDCELVEGQKKTHLLLRLTNKAKNVSEDLLIAPFGNIDPDAEFKGIIISSSEKHGRFRRLTIRGLTRAKVDVEITEEKLKKGNGDTLLIQDYIQEKSANGLRHQRFDRPMIRMRDALVGIMNLDLKFVEGINEIDDRTLSKSSRFALALESDGNALRKRIFKDRYYADRRRITEDTLGRLPGHTAEFDDRKEHEPRFGKATVVFPTVRTRQGRSSIWSPSLEVKKIVINPYASALPKRFKAEDWKDTLVIFHSRDKDAARTNRRAFGDWLAKTLPIENQRRHQMGLSQVDEQSLGLVLFHSSVPSKVRGKIRGFLTQLEFYSYELDHLTEQEQHNLDQATQGDFEFIWPEDSPSDEPTRISDLLPGVRNRSRDASETDSKESIESSGNQPAQRSETQPIEPNTRGLDISPELQRFLRHETGGDE